MKYKRKKQRNSVLIISCIIIILFVCMGTGYAFFSGTFTLNGSVKSKYTGRAFPLNEYFSIIADDPNNFAKLNLSDGSISVVSQSISQDNSSVTYKINVHTGIPRIEIVSFVIQNTGKFPMTNGTFKYTVGGTALTVVDGTITSTMPQMIPVWETRNHTSNHTFKI